MRLDQDWAELFWTGTQNNARHAAERRMGRIPMWFQIKTMHGSDSRCGDYNVIDDSVFLGILI